MKVFIRSLLEGARKAKGLVVVIDVFRAFSNAAHVMNNGAEKLIPVAEVKEAFELKKKNPEFVLMGERNSLKIDGFEYGNSPFEASKTNFSGKTIIFTTSSGTQGIIAAKNAEEIILGNFVCMHAIASYIKKKNPEVVTIVPMGDRGAKKNCENELCAKMIKDLLEDKAVKFDKIKEKIRNSESAQRFFDKNRPEPEEDFFYSLDLDQFDFVLKVVEENGRKVIVKYDLFL